MRPTAAIYLITLLLWSCRGPSEPVPLWAPGMETPIIPGIYRTNEMGDVLGEIGLPFSPEDPSGLLEVSPANPNPTNGSTEIRFILSQSAYIKVWIVSGIGAFEDVSSPEWIHVTNKVAAVPGGVSVQVSNEHHQYNPFIPGPVPVGYHRFNIRMDETHPDGYYRCYIQADDVLLWTDILWLCDPSCNNMRRLGINPDWCN